MEVIPPRVLAEGTPTRTDTEILRQVGWTTGMRDMVCCLGWRESSLLGLSFIGSLDGFDVRLVGNAFCAFCTCLGLLHPFEETVY